MDHIITQSQDKQIIVTTRTASQDKMTARVSAYKKAMAKATRAEAGYGKTPEEASYE